MRYKEFGKTGEKLSALTVGTWAIGGAGWGEVNKADCIKAIHAMFDNGVNSIDTAPCYNCGESERIVGEALKGRRDKIFLTTKTAVYQPDPQSTIIKDGRRETILRLCDESLKNLQTDYIDIYQFHCVDMCYRPGDGTGMYECMLEAKEQGKIRHIGVTAHKLNVARECVESGLYETLQYPLSYLSSEKEVELVNMCRERNMGFIAMKGLAGGLINNSKAAFAYMSQFDNVLPIWGIQKMEELEEWLGYMTESPVYDEEIKAFIEKEKAELTGDFCRGCGYCMPCPAGIQINNCARMSLMVRRAPSANWLNEQWQENMKQIENCLDCGQCKSKCPYELDTPNLLRKNYEDYKKILAGEVEV